VGEVARPSDGERRMIRNTMVSAAVLSVVFTVVVILWPRAHVNQKTAHRATRGHSLPTPSSLPKGHTNTADGGRRRVRGDQCRSVVLSSTLPQPKPRHILMEDALFVHHAGTHVAANKGEPWGRGRHTNGGARCTPQPWY
jgi:hypothetical protein